ncbi:MAG: hypothetical protein DRR19_07560 [Candidatus Parabeggiatoa sp. nov. 1]|nr:MAG: hypothetical protein DRR19_07560 [Gammaproteobacteria bacterium]
MFGITRHCNPPNWVAFKQALLNHLINVNTVMIKGTYREQQTARGNRQES